MKITQQEQSTRLSNNNNNNSNSNTTSDIVQYCGSSRQPQTRQMNSNSSPKTHSQSTSSLSSIGCRLLGKMNDGLELLLTNAGSDNNKIMKIKSAQLSFSLPSFTTILFLAYLIGTTTTTTVLAQASLSSQDTSSGLTIDGVDGANPKTATEATRNLRDVPLADKLSINATNAFEFLLKKKPYSKYWSVEQKWDDLFKRFISVQGTFKQMAIKSFMRDIEYYADITISGQCEQDLKFIQNYLAANSRNMRWLSHMIDSTGKNEPGMLTGNLAHLGHVVQCIKVRAPARPTNDSFDERYFEQQTATLGERFRGKYCLASIRPVLPEKPHLISRFSNVLNVSLLSNVSYTGETPDSLKQRARQLVVPRSVHDNIDRNNLRLDQVPFESQLYEYLLMQRNFMYSLPRYMGVCYPSSCSQDDIRISLQKTMDDQHQVVDIEFECEQEERDGWQWFSTPRLIAYVILILIVATSFLSSVARHILVDRMLIKRSKLPPNSPMSNLLATLELLSMDKCAGILFIKTKQASPYVDWAKIENNRSTSIDALKGFLVLVLIYSQMTVLGCLPVPFMWTKWADAMFPFYRSIITQVFLNMTIWTEAFYMISAYLIGLKLLENCRPKRATLNNNNSNRLDSDKREDNMTMTTMMIQPNLISFVLKRYVRLLMPMVAFMLLNYVWPRLSNGFVMQDQANKILAPCDNYGWTNLLMFHNYYQLNETCLWPSHVSASFFQLHLISYPILVLFLLSFKQTSATHSTGFKKTNATVQLANRLFAWAAILLVGLFALIGCIYPALKASQHGLIVPFLIDYIDFDNYQRVIEWMVLPAYNHLTSYMMGLALAYLVVKRRVDVENRRASSSSSDWSGHYINRENSFESVRSSSTQELHSSSNNAAPPVLLFSNKNNDHLDQQQHRLAKLNLYAPNQSVTVNPGHDNDHHQQGCCLAGFLKTTLTILSLLLVLVSSWFWNGLGQPMSAHQTFAYVSLSKLCFSLSFAYLFYSHFATRKNANNPWMLTRFLVPIGRMSLMLFYMSWLVIWFDLLSSPFQWHPSHYFIGEKYNEIIFMSLVLSMFAYGAFEGTIKRVQYAKRMANICVDEANKFVSNQSISELPTTINKSSSSSSSSIRRQQQQLKTFESFFQPANKKFDSNKAAQADSSTVDRQQVNLATSKQQPVFESTPSNAGGADRQSSSSPGRRLTQAKAGACLKIDASHLSPSDQYKLNAELRANYSFASIGLYESVGATGDLAQLSTGDLQVSPASSHRRS